MRSSTGAYYIGLDHLRALATFQVFTWHFLHFSKASELSVAPLPWAFLGEGHVGVALFMTLSGYIFAKLLSGKDIVYTRFVWNRCVRLLPLLTFVLLLVTLETYVRGGRLGDLGRDLAWGWLKPTLPNGGWSITAEFHFYLLLPWLLLAMRRWRRWMWLGICVTIALRFGVWWFTGSVQGLAFWTIVGRFDQFLLGMYAFECRHFLKSDRLTGAGVVLAWLAYLSWFDARGGYHGATIDVAWGAIWIVEPTLEAVFCALLIVWYDGRMANAHGWLSRRIAAIGTYSYSIYLLHPFVVFWLSRTIHAHILDLHNFYAALLASLACFCVVVPLGYLSFRFVEAPFLRLRTPYFRTRVAAATLRSS